ncbi:MAG: tyrosine-type recombinase/integrase [Acidimicrobiales bacterium]
MSVAKRITARGEVRWDARVRAPDGKERSRTFSTRKAAMAWERAQRSAKDAGTWLDPSAGRRITVAAWAERWLADHHRLSVDTQRQYEIVLGVAILPPLGRRSLASVTRRDVQQLVAGWSKERKPATVVKRLSVLKGMLDAAVEAELLGRNPAAGVKTPTIKPVPRSLPSAEQLDSLFKAIGPDYRLLPLLAVLTGLRWSEAAALRVTDVDVLGRSLRVAQRLKDRPGEGGVIVSGAKTVESLREMAIGDRLAEQIAAHLVRRGLTAADGEALLFVRPDGRPLSYSWFSVMVWGPARGEVGLPSLGFHDLRRLSATLMVASGVDLRTAQHRMGHSKAQTLLALYAQVVQQADADAAELLEGKLLDRSRDGRGMNRKTQRPQQT